MLRRYYRHRLIENELLVVIIHEHWRKIALPILYTLLLASPLLVLAFTIADTSWGRWVLLVAAVLALGAWSWFALPKLTRWYAKSYAVTTRRVLFREGLSDTVESQVELVGVASPSLRRSRLDVLWRSGTIDLGGGHVLERIRGALKHERLINQLAANQQRSVMELTQLLRGMGYSRFSAR